MEILFWLGFFIILLFFEVITVSLVTIWFCLGAFMAMVAVLFGASITVQFLIFVSVSFASLALTYPIAEKYFKAPHKPTNIDLLIGREVTVLSDINNDMEEGEIAINDVVWTARTTNGERVNAGKRVIIDSIKGVKLYVSEVTTEV